MPDPGQNDKTNKENLIRGIPMEGHLGKDGETSWFFGVGINAYVHFPRLNNAVKDVKDVAILLQDQYGLDPEHTILLFDEAATRDNIIIELDHLKGLVAPDDKLIVYYSGHGHLDSSKKGFWIPVDAERENTAHYIRNSTIRDYIEDISSRHTLIISDSCFSGALFVRGASRADFAIEELEQRPSRWALCSGRHDEQVFDGEPGKNSPFTESVLDILRSNHLPKLNVAKLADRVIELTRANYQQLPEGNPLYGVGHKGGQYVFKLRASEENLWERCQQENTIASFNAYLDQFPSGRFADQALLCIRELEDENKWQEVRQVDQVYAYRDYLRRFPEGKYELETRARMKQLEQPGSFAKGRPPAPVQKKETTPSSPEPQRVEKRKPLPSSSSWRRNLVIGIGLMVALFIGIWIIRLASRNQGKVESENTGLELFESGGKYGYRDQSGKEIIAPRFEAAEPFQNGYALVKKDGQAFLIDTNGDCVADCPEELDKTAWAKADRLDNLDTYKAYLKEFPNGQFSSEARGRITQLEVELQRDQAARRDQQAWETAKKKNDITAYENYQQKFPSGRYYNQSQEQIEVLKKSRRPEEPKPLTLGTTITGRVLYGGYGATPIGVISSYSNANAEINLMDVELRQNLSIEYDYDPQTGHYSINNVPAGKYTPFITIQSGYPFNKNSGGDYISFLSGLNEDIIVAPNDKTINRDLKVVHSIHLKRPMDNQKERTFANAPPEILYRQGFNPSAEVFEWDPVPEATRYNVRILLTDGATGNNIDTKSFETTETSIRPGLEVNQGNTYYMFNIEAYKGSSNYVGDFTNYYKNGFGGWFLFKVLEKPN